MSWCTELRTNITFNRKTYQFKDEVEGDLEAAKEAKKSVLWDILRKNTNLESWELNELEENLEEAIIRQYKLGLLLDCWDELPKDKANGKPVPEILSGRPQIWGDFINVKTENLYGKNEQQN